MNFCVWALSQQRQPPFAAVLGSEHQYIATGLLQPHACALEHLCMVLTVPGVTAACMNFACLTMHTN